MAQFSGYVCDECERVVPSGLRVKQTIKFDGREVAGEVSLDLCPECARTQAETYPGLRPLRRRTLHSGDRQEPPIPTPERTTV